VSKFISQWIAGFVLLLSLGVLSVIFTALVQSRDSMPFGAGLAIGLAYFVLVPWLSYHIARFVVGSRGETEKQSPVEEMFNRAFKLDRRGDWAEAIDLYEQIAEMLPDEQEGQYARNCAQQLRAKMATNA
jgi:hypothetical protein